MIDTERMTIRRAEPEAINDIIALEGHPDNRDHLWQGTYADHLAEISDPNHLLLVFRTKADSALVGFALVRLDRHSSWFELRRIAVSIKKQGYGREAMLALFAHAFDTLGMNKVWLDVYPHNTVGIRLYESLGMHRDGILRENYRSSSLGFLDQIIYSMLRREYVEIKPTWSK